MRLPPTRPLPASCYWLREGNRAHLHWNAGCIGYVVPCNGKFLTVIQWQRRVLSASCGSIEQGMRWIERWVEKRDGFPGGGKAKWHDNPERERRQIESVFGATPYRHVSH